MRKTPMFAPLALAALALALPAQAAEKGDWTFSLGAHVVAPTSGNGSLAGGALDADVGNDWRPTVTAEYFFSPNWGLEVLAALPFEHDIALNGVRLSARSFFVTDSDGTVSVDGTRISSPYTWQVIGASDTIATALQIQAGSADQMRAKGATVTITTQGDVIIDAVASAPAPTYASVE